MTRSGLRSGILRRSDATGRHLVVAMALFVLTMLVATVFVGTACAEPMFVVTGRGYGHGLGMSQMGAQGFATASPYWTYRRILSHYFQKTTIGNRVGDRAIRVALQADNLARASWTMRAPAGKLLVVRDGDGYTSKLVGGEYYSLRYSSGVDRQGKPTTGLIWFKDHDHDGVRSSGDAATFSPHFGLVSVQASSGSAWFVQVHSPSGPWGEANVLWRGKVKLTLSGSSLKAVNHVAMEDYLRGVVPRESPAYYKPEALKAQAVAARGYAWCSLTPGNAVFDVYCTTASQVYDGYGSVSGTSIDVHEEKSTDLAVSSTASQVVKYGSVFVKTFFFSTSGGRTESTENVWGGDPVPYYTSVLDPYESRTSRWTAWPATYFTPSQLRARLKAPGAGYTALPVPAVLTDIVVTKRGKSGRIMTAVLKGATGHDDKIIGLGSPYFSTRGSQLGSISTLRHCLIKPEEPYSAHDTWIYFTKSAVTAPVSAQYGVPLKVKVTVSPAYTGNVTVDYGPGGVSSLPGRTRAALVRGVGYASLPGLTAATDVFVMSGSLGTGTRFQSRRVRISVSRRAWVSVRATGRLLAMTAGVRPIKAGLPVYFWVRAPRSTTWVRAGAAKLSSLGAASLTWRATGPGIWAVRVATPATPGFVSAGSPQVNVSVLK